MLRRWLLPFAIAVVAARGAGQDADEGPAQEDEQAEPPPADAEARGLFLAGQAAFRDQRWDDALRYFRDAYALSPRPGLLYNLGVAADRLRRDGEAVEAFEHFLREAADDDPHIAEARARVRVLRETLAREPTIATTIATPHRGGDATGGWVLFGASSAIAIAGAILLVIGQLDAQAVEGAADGTPWLDVADAAGRADLLRNMGWIALAAGAGIAAVGLIWAIVEGNSASDAHAQLEIGPNGARLRGTF